MLARVRIDDRTWEEAAEARRLEWQAAIREMLVPGEAVFREDAEVLEITLTQQAVVLELRDARGAELADVLLAHDLLADLIREYVDIVRELARADARGGVSRLEALDMAKKVTHDKAGRLIERRCRAFGIDHPTARRLFSLILALRVDTTRLHGVHGHRRIR